MAPTAGQVPKMMSRPGDAILRINKEAEQVVTHQPDISISNSSHFHFNRAGGRTSNVLQRNKMHLRPFKKSDELAVVSLWQDCGLIVPHNNPHKDIARKLAVNPELFIVGEVAGVVIGSCMIGYEGHRGWINYLAVHPEYQRTGFAKQLMSEAERLLRELGCPKINLQIRSTNASVIAFYESLGFVEDNARSFGLRLENDEDKKENKSEQATPRKPSD